ncbi:MAG: hypothetical protein GY838_11105 [bacterium]|nr:hypothetical protein [bacterium]
MNSPEDHGRIEDTAASEETVARPVGDQAEPRPDRIGQYTVKRAIASGGMGTAIVNAD